MQSAVRHIAARFVPFPLPKTASNPRSTGDHGSWGSGDMKVFVPFRDADMDSPPRGRLVPYHVDRACWRGYADNGLVEVELEAGIRADVEGRESPAVELKHIAGRSVAAVRRTA